jgi:hypothetical protein
VLIPVIRESSSLTRILYVKRATLLTQTGHSLSQVVWFQGIMKILHHPHCIQLSTPRRFKTRILVSVSQVKRREKLASLTTPAERATDERDLLERRQLLLRMELPRLYPIQKRGILRTRDLKLVKLPTEVHQPLL